MRPDVKQLWERTVAGEPEARQCQELPQVGNHLSCYQPEWRDFVKYIKHAVETSEKSHLNSEADLCSEEHNEERNKRYRKNQITP